MRSQADEIFKAFISFNSPKRYWQKKKQILGYDQTSWLRLSSMMRNPSSHLVLKYGILSQNNLKYEKILSQIFIGAIVKNFQEKRRLL